MLGAWSGPAGPRRITVVTAAHAFLTEQRLAPKVGTSRRYESAPLVASMA
ncbi:hypothetical protein [Streptomyces sp. NPDC086777]